MNREEVIRQIVAREMSNKSIDATKVESQTPELFVAANELFGTWETALKYAGIRHYEKRAVAEFSREAVLRKLRHICNNGYVLGSRHNQKRDPQLFAATRKHFGTWTRALKAAGINVQRLSRGIQGRKSAEVIEEIKKRYDQGMRMDRCHVMLEDNDLCMVAIRLFGSWGRALTAAGITPPEPYTQWNPEKVLQMIQIMHERGHPLRYKDVRKSERSLVNAVRRYFGNWDAAMEAAGLDQQIQED